MQQKIPFMIIRGGSSKGLFFNAEDLSDDEQIRNEQIIKAMEGSLLGDPRQIDGLGGATSLSSKVAIVSRSKTKQVDLDYLFLQVIVGKGKVSSTQTCGNMLAGVLPFALETGLFPFNHEETSARIQMLNTGGICEVIVQTPNKKIAVAGNTKVDGVMGTGAPIVCNYLDTLGATCGALLPSGNAIDMINDVEVTCVDNGMPVVLINAQDLGLNGNESKAELEAMEELKVKIENIRIQAGWKMNLGDVHEQTIPKIGIVSKPLNGGILTTRMFIPHVVHEAIGVLAAVSIATACIIKGSVAWKVLADENLSVPDKLFSIEHPSGEFTVNLDFQEEDNDLVIKNSGVLRTARILAKGEVYIP